VLTLVGRRPAPGGGRACFSCGKHLHRLGICITCQLPQLMSQCGDRKDAVIAQHAQHSSTVGTVHSACCQAAVRRLTPPPSPSASQPWSSLNSCLCEAFCPERPLMSHISQ